MSQHPVDPKKLKGWKEALGPLKSLFEDPSISEIMVNGPSKIFIEQRGIIKKTPLKFNTTQELMELMQGMASAVGRKLDWENPYVDARLPDGSRVNCVVGPVAVDGPALTIRRFSAQTYTLQDLVNSKSLDEKMAFFLHCCVVAKINIVISGGTGSGKTTLLNALSLSIPPHERMVTIEDSAELRLKHENLVRMESSKPTSSSPGVSMRELVINALRMRPDRIILGECRGREVIDVLTAMNTGHEGSLTTVHANSAREAIRRMESMILLSGEEIPLRVARTSLAQAIQLIVQVSRLPDGSRRVQEVLEISGMEGDVILSQEIFRYQANIGHAFTGFVPRLIKLFAERGVDFPKDFFAEGYQIKMGRS